MGLPTQGLTAPQAPKADSTFRRPPQPTTIQEAGISTRVVEGLILKTIKQRGALTEQQIADSMKVAVNVIRDQIQQLLHREVLDTPSPLHFDLTAKGRELTGQYETEDAYVGPAPVSFELYCEKVQEQSKQDQRVTQEDVNNNFAKFPMREELLRILKEGFNSQRVVLFWGPPGNGKSLVTDNLHRLLKHAVILPYAFEFSNRVVKVFDPAFHKLEEDLMEQEDMVAKMSLASHGKPDQRWLISKPPLVTVGTEFRVEHFQIAFDGQFDAPPHVKANNGIFIFDDLGRQTQDHNMILNQFIYPLEQQEAIIKFAGGSSIRVPYKQRLFLSTNLNLHAVIDDAFSRRLLYQVLVDRPTDAIWKKIVTNSAQDAGIDEQTASRLARILLGWYKRDGRVIRAADPRNVFIMLDAVLLEGEDVNELLDLALFERIYQQYPAAYEKDAVAYALPEVVGPEEFKQRFREVAGEFRVKAETAARLADKCAEWFQRDGRLLRIVDPQNIFSMIDGLVAEEKTTFEQLDVTLFESIYEVYPPYTQADLDRAMSQVGIGGQ